MAMEQVAASLERVVSALRRKPHAGLHEDTPATVRWAGGLRTVARTAAGAEVVTDMPVAIGGDDSAPTPGWLLRTALASCAVTRIAMEAASRGIALHKSFGSIVAQVAEVSLTNGQIRVHRVVCAIDCGTVVNPGTVAQQMESSVVYALSAALFGKIDIVGSVVQQSNFSDAPMLTLSQTPTVETHIVPSTRHPAGVGEPAVPPLAPAVGNALFALTGKRQRALPITA
jgi:isoquinoline 1-oxidoreductase beta subunit